MRSILALIALTALVSQAGCATAPRGEGEAKRSVFKETLAIQKVGVYPKTFRPEQEEFAVIRWTQNRKAHTVVEILTEEGRPVRRFEALYPSGDHVVTWDGRDGAGSTVTAGVYLYSFRSRISEGEEIVYDPSSSRGGGGGELTIEQFTFDPKTRQFEFILPRAGRARLRIGLSPYLHLRTLLDWKAMEAGRHTLEWDGLDASGWIKAIDHPNLSINLTAFSLPDNAILVDGKSEEARLLLNEEVFRRTLREGLYLHAGHSRARCRDISFDVEFPNSQKNEEGVSLLEDQTIVRVRLKEFDRNFMVDQRFEIMFSLDTVFLFEEEEGQDPFNFLWDTRGISPGEHLLSVNLIGYEDHLGVKTVRVLKR